MNQAQGAVPRGRFITVEGGEGVGKSRFSGLLAHALRARGLPLVTTREPGGTPTADRIRSLFAEPAANDPLLMPAEALLVSAARAQHVGRLIAPALQQGQWVLCDRFADSTRVYQGTLGGLESAPLEELIRFSTSGLQPDLTFLLDCDVAVARRRIGKSAASREGAIDRYDRESATFHERLREAYLALARREGRRIVTLDAALAPESVAQAAMKTLEERFGGF